MIVNALFAWASSIPPWFATIVLSALPITESRLTIPVAITVWKLSPAVAYFFAMVGNAIPFLPIFFGFRSAKVWAERYAPWSVQWFERGLLRAERKLGTSYQKFGLIAIALFVAIPLPGTGVWTGTLAAVAIGLSTQRAAIAVLGGMLIMGAIVLGLTFAGIAVV